VTFPPGGSSDIVIRALQPLLSEDLHQPIVIENRAGAGGNIGIGAVAQAAPDGYVLGVAAAGVLTVNPHLNRAAMPFDPRKDLAPVTLLAEIPFVLVASQKSNFSSVADVIAAAKTRSDVSIGHGGNGTAMHLTSALFNQKAGVSIQLVAYRGFLPDVPPLSETGLNGFESVGWFGVVAPAGTPPDIIRRLNAAFVKALKDPAAIEKIRILGAEPAPSSPEDFAKFIRDEDTKWGELIAASGLKAE